MTANRGRASHHWETVLTNLGFSTGRHYWEIIIDVYGTEEDIFIGICKNGNKLQSHAVENSCWGWQTTSGRKIWPSTERIQEEAYGDYTKIGEIIGVLLEFDNEKASLTYIGMEKAQGKHLIKYHQGPGIPVYPC